MRIESIDTEDKLSENKQTCWTQCKYELQGTSMLK